MEHMRDKHGYCKRYEWSFMVMAMVHLRGDLHEKRCANKHIPQRLCQLSLFDIWCCPSRLCPQKLAEFSLYSQRCPASANPRAWLDPSKPCKMLGRKTVVIFGLWIFRRRADLPKSREGVWSLGTKDGWCGTPCCCQCETSSDFELHLLNSDAFTLLQSADLLKES